MTRPQDEFTTARLAAAPLARMNGAVLAAIEDGRIPAGGPSETAARGLTMPPAAWAEWSARAAARIREQAGRATQGSRGAGRRCVSLRR